MIGPRDPWMVAYLDQITGIIGAHGHANQLVVGDGDADSYTYTVGLTAQGRPELWIATVDRRWGLLLNDLVAKEPPEAFIHGAVLGGDRWTFPVRLRGPVDTEAADIGVVEHLYPDSPVTCLQVLWCDPAGRYPDEDGYDESWRQRLLPLAAGFVP